MLILMLLSHQCMFSPTTSNVPELSLLLAGITSGSGTYSKFLFLDTQNDSRVRSLQIDRSTGALTQISSIPTTSGGIGMAIHPTVPAIYVTRGGSPGGVDAFSFDANTGALTFLVSRQMAGGDNFSHRVMVSPSGDGVFTNHVQSVTEFYRSPLDSGGFPAAGVRLAPVLGNNSQFAVFHPDGSFIYAGRDPGSGGGIQKYSVTAGTGAMTDLGNTLFNGTDTITSANFPFGGSPLVAATSTGDVLTMSKDGAGNLSIIQRTATGGPFAIGVVSANESYFYVVTTASTLQTYSLTSGGAMTLIDQTSPMLGGAISFSMCRDMSGRFLFVNEFTGPNSETHVFRTDGDGRPRFAGSYLMGDQIRACVASTDQP